MNVLHFTSIILFPRESYLITSMGSLVHSSTCAPNYYLTITEIICGKYEEKIIRHQAEIPMESLWKDVGVRSGWNKRRDGAQNVGRTGAKRRTDGQTDTLQTVSDWSQRVNPITHRRARFIVWTGDWLRVPDTHDGGSHSLRWPWARNESGDRGGTGRKVSCGFTHPIIRALKTTLTIGAPEEVLDARNGFDRIYRFAFTTDPKQYIIDVIYRSQLHFSPSLRMIDRSMLQCRQSIRRNVGFFRTFLMAQDQLHLTLFDKR